MLTFFLICSNSSNFASQFRIQRTFPNQLLNIIYISFIELLNHRNTL